MYLFHIYYLLIFITAQINTVIKKLLTSFQLKVKVYNNDTEVIIETVLVEVRKLLLIHTFNGPAYYIVIYHDFP